MIRNERDFLKNLEITLDFLNIISSETERKSLRLSFTMADRQH